VRRAVLAAALLGALAGSGTLAVAAFTDEAVTSGSSWTASGGFVPVMSSVPDVLGSHKEGSVLSVNLTSWSKYPANGTPSYQWQRCDATATVCTPLGTAATHTVTAADVNFYLRVTVTSQRNGSGNTVAVTSNLTTQVLDEPAIGDRATNTATPTITGTTTVGQTLTAVPGTWSGSTTYNYQWQRCQADGSAPCTAVGTDSNLYTLVAGDQGRRMRVQVTGTLFLGSASVAVSADTSLVN
jgi:hypothetical protein